MKITANKKTFLVIDILFAIALSAVVLTNMDRIAVWQAPKKQAAKSRSEAAKKADDLFWQPFHQVEYEKIQLYCVSSAINKRRRNGLS